MFEHFRLATVSTGIEPAIFAVTGRRDNRYTTRPSELMLFILKAHCQNKNYQLCDDLLTSVLDYALPNRSLVAIVTGFGRYLALGVVSPYFQHYELMLVSTALTYSVVLRMPLKMCSCNPYVLVS